MSTVTVEGNLTRDLELRFTPSGTAVCEGSVAENRRYTPAGADTATEQTSFYDFTVWQTQAENVVASLKKGDRVIITGRLEQVSWVTDDGDKRSKVRIVVNSIGVALRFAHVEGIAKNPRKGDWVPEEARDATAPAPRPNPAEAIKGELVAAGSVSNDEEPF